MRRVWLIFFGLLSVSLASMGCVHPAKTKASLILIPAAPPEDPKPVDIPNSMQVQI